MTTTAEKTVAELEVELRDVEGRIDELEEANPAGGDPAEIREDAERIREELADEKAVAEELRKRIAERKDAEGRDQAHEHRRELRDRAYTAGADALAGAQQIERHREELVKAVEETIEGLEDYRDLMREARLAEELWTLDELEDKELARVGELDLPDLGDLEDRFEETLRAIRKLRDEASGRHGRRKNMGRMIWSITYNPDSMVSRTPYSRARSGVSHISSETWQVVRRPYVQRLQALYEQVPEKDKHIVLAPPELG